LLLLAKSKGDAGGLIDMLLPSSAGISSPDACGQTPTMMETTSHRLAMLAANAPDINAEFMKAEGLRAYVLVMMGSSTIGDEAHYRVDLR
jgi:hypothetical protein